MIQTFVIPLVLLVLAGWFFVKTAAYFCSLFASPAEVVFVPFEAGSEDQKKQAPVILSAKLRELQTQGKQAPTGYGFLTVPLLESTPQLAEEKTQTLSVLDNIEFKIKDVSVPALIKAFDAVFTPAHYEVRGSVNELSDSTIVRCQLLRHDKVIASWEASQRTGKTAGARADDDATKAARFEELLDQLLYQMIFDFGTKPQFEEWNTKLETGSRAGGNFGNWRSFRAYMRGLKALRTYQQDLDYNDLTEALGFFEQLAITDPENAFGLYFRAQALSENREEEEAIGEFEQL